MKKVCSIVSKLILILLVIGFFQPLCCDCTGPELLECDPEDESEFFCAGVIFLIVFILGAVGVLLVFIPSEKADSVVAWIALISLILLLIIPCYIMIEIDEDIGDLTEFLNGWFFVMMAASILSYVLQKVKKYIPDKNR